MLLILAAVVLAAEAGALTYVNNNKIDTYKSTVADLQQQITSNARSVYVAQTDIKAGEQLVDGKNIAASDIQSSTDQSLFMAADQIGQVAQIDINMGTPITTNMIEETVIEKDTRIVDVDTVLLASTDATNDMVDIRILFPDGTDYIVLAKQELRNVNGSSFQLYLNEGQLLTLRSAVVDAADLGATLYTTKYIQRNLQDAAEAFYPVRPATLDIFNSNTDPNISDKFYAEAEATMSARVRAALEARMAEANEDGTNPQSATVNDDSAAQADSTTEDADDVSTADVQ